ncbi:unnamed protein product [Arabidopsis halleri]
MSSCFAASSVVALAAVALAAAASALALAAVIFLFQSTRHLFMAVAATITWDFFSTSSALSSGQLKSVIGFSRMKKE